MKKILFFLLISLLAISCARETKLSIPEHSDLFGLASPIQLNNDITPVWLTDYFPEPKVIDSVKPPAGLDMTMFGKNGKIALKIVSDSLPWLMTLDVYAHGYKYSIPVRKPRKIKYLFIFNPHGKHYKSVYIRGEMNSWNSTATPLTFDPSDSTWKVGLLLEPGIYQYLLVLDGKDHLDPNNPDSVSNGMGGFNSILKVGHMADDSLPYLYTLSYNKKYILLGFENNISEFQVFYDNFLLPSSFVSLSDNKIKIRIPRQAAQKKRSYIRVFAANRYGLANDIFIPLDHGQPISSVSQITRTDYRAAVIYNVFVDRFCDGDSTNDEPITDGSVLPKANFMGGDLLGIIEKVRQGYFDSLGVNTLWISPIMLNVKGAYGLWPNPRTKFSAYHGYWPISFTRIDPRFGTPDQLKHLVSLLHKNDKNLIIDYVAHHVHKESWFYKEHPDWTTSLYLPDGTLNTEKWDTHRLTTWFDTFLPTLDNTRPEVYQMVTDSAVWWIKHYNLDGFRHDAAKHVPLVFWRTLTRKLKLQVEIPEHRKLYQIGETYGSPELIASYLGTGLLDAQFDFNVYDALITALADGNSFTNLRNVLNTSFKYYGWHNLMGYITGNQDRGRFISYASGTLSFSENPKVAGWTRDIEVGDTIGYNRSALLFSFITTIPGVPVVYYGDEIGMPGGNDPDNRRMMIFDGLNKHQKWLKNQAAKLIHLRRSSLALIYGDFKWIYTDDNVMVYQRTYFDKIVIVAINKDSKPHTVKFNLPARFLGKRLQAPMGGDFTHSGSEITVNLKPISYIIIKN